MPPARFDPERHTSKFAALGVVALAAAFHTRWAIPFAMAFFSLACLSDTRKLYLFGPFLHHELRGMTRRVRNHLWWPLIALLASVPVFGLHFAVTQLPPESAPPAESVPLIAAGGFLFVFWILMIVTLSLASTYLCYGIAEDRESKRLDFQLVTDLRGRELVIGKLLARLVAVLMYPAAAVPIILTMPLLFRMDPSIILYAFAYGGVMLASLAGLSALGSVIAATKKSSGNWMALFVMPYLFVIFLLSMLRFTPEVWLFPGTPTSPTAYCLGDLIEAISIGNPLTLLVKWMSVGMGIGNLDVIATDFPGFASFHVAVGGFAFLLAARKVRTASANAGEVVNPPAATTATKGEAGEIDESGESNPRPPVDDEPVKWKEVHCNPLLVAAQKNETANVIATIVLVYFPAVLFTVSAFSSLGGYGPFIANDLARYAPIIVASIGIFTTQNLALHSVARERERDTMLNLLLSDFSSGEILRQKLRGILRLGLLGDLTAQKFQSNKLYGVLRLGRSVVCWLIIIGISTVICGAYHWWAFLGLLLYQLVFMFVMASAGLCFSANAPNIQVATKRFGLAAFFSMVALGLITSAIAFAASATGTIDTVKFLAIGLIPPFGLVGPGFAKLAPRADWPYWIAGYLFGLTAYAGLGWFLWKKALRRFAAACDGSAARGPLLDNRTQ